MKQWIYIMAIFAVQALTMQSCKEEVPEASKPVELHSRVSPQGEAAKAVLYFWDSDTFQNNWLKGGGTDAHPIFGPVSLQNEIDYYRHDGGRVLTVGMEYPSDEREYIYATGYAPEDALSISSDYKTLTVRDGYKDGKTDFLCCDGKDAHKGSANDPFTNEAHELMFRHMTPRIRFVGKRDPVTYGVISVNNVKVTLHDAENSLSVPRSFVYYRSNENDWQTYVAQDFQPITEPITLEQETTNYIPANDNGLSLASCYVFHGDLPDDYNPFADAPAGSGTETVTLTMDIEADYSWYNDGNPIRFESPRWEKKTVEVRLEHGGNCFYPGYEYVVYITFKRESVILQGVQQNWDDGGIHYLPVAPPDNNNNY